MTNYYLDENGEISRSFGPEPELIVAELVPEPPPQELPVRRVFRRRVRLPALLFIATCLSTLLAGCLGFGWSEGWKYALPLMTILICHEAGHFLQARRYGVYASFPYFIPMPISPLGTFGAVIVMEPRMGHRRALFDIGITGPLAGLVPTLVFCVIGLHLSTIAEVQPGAQRYGDPLLLKYLAELKFGPIPEGHDIRLNPILFAGWVGLLITALNLMPIGQLDGGHVLYALLRKRAHHVASFLLLAAVVAVIWQWKELFLWTPMLFLLALMGPVHPPTANDGVPLGAGRVVLGWLTLAFIPIGFTPWPFIPGS